MYPNYPNQGGYPPSQPAYGGVSDFYLFLIWLLE